MSEIGLPNSGRGVGVGVGSGVAVGDGVIVGVGVLVAVGLGVFVAEGVGIAPTPAIPQACKLIDIPVKDNKWHFSLRKKISLG